MKEVDARGLSCPEPLMLTAEALKGASEPVKILVTEPHQKMNVEKYDIPYHGRCHGNGEGMQGTERAGKDYPGSKSHFGWLRPFLVRGSLG